MQSAVSSYPSLKVFLKGAHTVIQPQADGTDQVETLSIDMASGSVEMVKSAPMSGPHSEAIGVMGVCKLFSGCALVIITEAKRCAIVGSSYVFQLTSAKVIFDKSAPSSPENRNLLKLLEDAVSPHAVGNGIYFSHTYDITYNTQRISNLRSDQAVAGTAISARSDARFMWNYKLAAPVLEAKASRFIVPCIHGFVHQLTGLKFSHGGKTAEGSLTLIARRAVHRAGTRHWRRGVDTEGNVANFAETEQILSLDNGSVVSSFTQLRGSIPLLWTQIPNIKYKPTTVIGPMDETAPCFDKHMRALLEAYKSVVMVNLVNHKGTEGRLEAAFRHEAERFNSTSSGVRYVPFDFHHECKKGRYHNISKLVDQVSSDFTQHGCFRAVAGQAVARQNGVVRTNCVDCLDRTNVVQGVMARKALESALQLEGLMGPTGSLATSYPDMEAKFRVLWADHGDALSSQYAGTGAMKSGFTRTGKRTFGGLLDDGYKAVARYFKNNFADGAKQDAYDVISGSFDVSTCAQAPFRAQPSPLVPVMIGLLALVLGGWNAAQFVTGNHGAMVRLLDGLPGGADQQPSYSASLSSFVKHVFVPLGVAMFAVLLIVKNGKHLVNKPQLCPSQAYTVRRARKQIK